jgi:ketosteroid isomerase-like protein
MKRQSVFIIWTALVIACVPVFVCAQAEGAAGPKLNKQDEKVAAAVRSVLDAQVAAWNRGDIEGFMDGYARSRETVFVSGDKVTHGWQTVLDNYKKGYSTREKMGQLAFSELEITPLSKNSAVALGRWQLTRAQDSPHGRFTLILRRTSAGWRIVHDHTS